MANLTLWGTIVNGIAILVGAFIGVVIPFNEKLRVTIMQGLGLAVVVIGLNMGLGTENVLLPIASLVLGGAIGEWVDIEKRLGGLGARLEKLWKKDSGQFTQGFLTATLVYCIGAMAILGALDSGLSRNHDVLYAKSMLDGVSAIFFASSFGVGVAFSALPVVLYQGVIALLANFLAPLLTGDVIVELTATGGMLILGIGLNILGVAKIRVGNLLPGLLFVVVLASLW